MKKLIALILAVVMCLSFAACGSSSGSGQAGAGGSAAAGSSNAAAGSSGAAAPSEGAAVTVFDPGLIYYDDLFSTSTADIVSAKKTAVISQAKDPGTLFPYKVSPSIYALAGWSICERLVVFNKEMEYVPNLVEGWEYSDDGLTFTFKLKEGILYSNGEEMVADDIAYLMKNWLITTSFGSEIKNYADFDTLQVLDKYTISVGLKYACPTAEDMLFKTTAIPLSYMEQEGDQLGINGLIGTGPYVFDEYIEGDHITVVANENYWNKENPAKLENIIFRFIPEASVALIEMENGNVDFIFDPSATEFLSVRDGGNNELVAWECDPVAVQILYFNCAGVLEDLALRQAVCCAIDQDAINVAVFEGLGNPATSFFPAGFWAYSDAMGEENYYAHDVARAKELLAQAGYPDGITLKMISNTSATFKAICEMLIGQLAEAGITLEVEYADSSTANSLAQDTTDFDIAIRQTGFTNDVYIGSLSRNFRADAGEPVGGSNWSKNKYLEGSDHLDEIMDQCKLLVDRESRKEAYAQAQQYYYEQAYGYALQDNVDTYIVSAKLRGIVRYSGYIDLGHIYFVE